MKTKNTGKEKGMITVEATVSLTVFLLLVLGVISFTNIFIVHSRVQYAMYQAEKELGLYTYFYEASGIRAADLKMRADLKKDRKPIDDTQESIIDLFNQVGTLKEDTSKAKTATEKAFEDPSLSTVLDSYNSVQGAVKSGKGTLEKGKVAADNVKWVVQNPKDAVRGLIALIVDEGEQGLKNWAMQAITGGIVDKYLEFYDSSGYHSAAEYLSKYGVVQKSGDSFLDLSASEMFVDEKYQLMDLVVQYDIEVYFFKIFMKDPTIHVVQRLKMPAWLGGDDVYFQLPGGK